jgi:hypothetical protein
MVIMTASKLTLSIPEELREMINEYNQKNPYNKLNLSRIAQKAIYNEIMKNR